MRVLMLRHAPAEEATAALSSARRRELRRVIYRLRRLQKGLDVVACGPSPGALETARMVAAAYGKVPVEALEGSCPNRLAEETLAWLRSKAGDSAIAVVDEEPALGRLAGFLTCGKSSRALALKARLEVLWAPIERTILWRKRCSPSRDRTSIKPGSTGSITPISKGKRI